MALSSHASYISQTPAPAPSSPPAPVLEWGVLGAIVFLVFKEGLALFKQKDQDEAALTGSLIKDIRDTNRELREYLESQKRSGEALRLELQAMEGRLARRQTEIIVDTREKLAEMGQVLGALHARLDKAEIHQASEKV